MGQNWKTTTADGGRRKYASCRARSFFDLPDGSSNIKRFVVQAYALSCCSFSSPSSSSSSMMTTTTGLVDDTREPFYRRGD
jgi:hypothetical protein